MLDNDRYQNDEISTTGDVLSLWHNLCTINLPIKQNSDELSYIDISYSYHFTLSDTEDVYISNNSIWYIAYYNYCINTRRIQYPSADIKDLSKYLPKVITYFTLADGKLAINIDKPDNIYPLAIFSNLDAKQVAWMISRFENLGCLYEFNNVDFTGIHIEDFYINPKTHELFMLTGWKNFVYNDTSNSHQYLYDIRKIALSIINPSTAPQMCLDWLNSTPEKDAYEDFKSWDNVIMTGFNGHNFHHFEGVKH